MSEELPDGVERIKKVGAFLAHADYDGNGAQPVTLVTGHGRVREMWEVQGIFHRDYSAAKDHARGFLSLIRRVIVIECDAAPAKE